MKSNGVLLLAPTKGNGGINTWTRTYLKTFDSKNYSLFSIDTSLKHRSQSSNSIIKRVLAGLLDLRILRRDVKRALKEHHFAIMHATTSGSLICNQIVLEKIGNEEVEYGYGRFQLVQILSIVPIFGEKIVKYLFPDQRFELFSGVYITTLYRGDLSTVGMGSTCLSDFYLDFGLAGVIFGMVVVGYVYNLFDKVLTFSKVNDINLIPGWLLLGTLYFGAHAIYIPRSTFLLAFKFFLNACFIFYLFHITVYFFTKNTKNDVF